MVVGWLSLWFYFNTLIWKNKELTQGSRPIRSTALPKAAAKSWGGPRGVQDPHGWEA